MWYCFMCALRLVNSDKEELSKYYNPSLTNGVCDCCNKEHVTVDWISEVDIKYLEAKNVRTQKPHNNS